MARPRRRGSAAELQRSNRELRDEMQTRARIEVKLGEASLPLIDSMDSIDLLLSDLMLLRPFQLNELVQRVREVLDA